MPAKNCLWKELVVFAENVHMWHYCLFASACTGLWAGLLSSICTVWAVVFDPCQRKKKGLGLIPAEIIISMKMRALRSLFDYC